jgi:hypothetical protein
MYSTMACAIYPELIINDAKNPHVVGTQIRFAGNAVSKIETISTSMDN